MSDIVFPQLPKWDVEPILPVKMYAMTQGGDIHFADDVNGHGVPNWRVLERDSEEYNYCLVNILFARRTNLWDEW